MSAWLPSCVALVAVFVALVIGPAGDRATTPSPIVAGTWQREVIAPVALSAPAAEAAAGADAVPSEPLADPADKGPQPLAILLDTWPVAVAAGRVDALTVRGDQLFVAVQTPPERPLIDPAVVRVHALDPTGAEIRVPWRAAILGPSPMALATSGDDVLAVWSHRAHPGRELASARLGADPDAGFEVLTATGGAFTPVGQPLLAPAADDGFLACSNTTAGAPRCVALGRDGERRWIELGALRSYALWRLVPNAAGYFLFATDCGRDGWAPDEASAVACRTPRVVSLALDGDGHPRGRMRWIGRFQGNRELGLVGLGDQVMLFGRRAGASESTALIIGRRAVKELDGRWNRTAAGVAAGGEVLLLEVDKLGMDGGLPVAGFRPRRWSAAGGRVTPERWPDAVAAGLPRSLEQRLVATGDAIALVEPPAGGLVRGVALRPRAGGSGLALAPPVP